MRDSENLDLGLRMGDSGDRICGKPNKISQKLRAVSKWMEEELERER